MKDKSNKPPKIQNDLTYIIGKRKSFGSKNFRKAQKERDS
jgi:hypothetical protein